MKALRLADTTEDKQKLDVKCRELLTRAEQIKKNKSRYPIRHNNSNNASSHPGVKLKEPLSKRELSTREQIILLEGAKLNGFVFPPWGAAPDPEQFELTEGDETFMYVAKMFNGSLCCKTELISGSDRDSPELPLSSLQREVFNGWKRPQELVSNTVSATGNESTPGPTMTAAGRVDLVQDVTTDCSVVASLCAAISRAERGYSKVPNLKLDQYMNLMMILF